MTREVHQWTAIQTADAVKAGRITVSACIAELTRRIQEKEQHVQAFAYFDPALALQQARSLEARADLSNLPLAGVAVAVKDIIATADMPTENGTPLDAGRRTDADAAVVRLLREAGAVIMGKAVTTELAFMHPSKTRNPHNLAHTPGGSSSGSAAAVAAGMVPIALGTQTNGSVIRPASFCGVFGYKPSFGLFPREGVLEEAGSLDTVGLFARSLQDLAAVTQVLAANSEKVDYLAAAQANAETGRVAFVKTPAWPFAEEAAKHVIQAAVDALGDSCETIALPASFNDAIGYHRTIMLSEMALNYGHYYDRGKDQLSGAMREAIETGRALLAIDYARALRVREQLYSQYRETIAPYSAVLTLPAPGPAPHGQAATGNPAFCTLGTYLGVPAFSLPLLYVNGLPLGIQLMGLRGEDARLFQSAAALLGHRQFQAAA
jgi:Asp-tRNA(Asn)/Glu-tRNA(Gln) amidotransferase A subunit family amidase